MSVAVEQIRQFNIGIFPRGRDVVGESDKFALAVRCTHHGAMEERRTAGYLWSWILPSVFSLRMRRSGRGTSS
jgi:hypothetical protein